MNIMHEANTKAAALGDCLSKQKKAIIENWRERVSADEKIPRSAELSEPALIDHIPDFLQALICSLKGQLLGDDSEERGNQVGQGEAATQHAHLRIAAGYRMAEALRELSHLRKAVLSACNIAQADEDAVTLVHEAIDQAMTEVAYEMARLRAREEDAHKQTKKHSEEKLKLADERYQLLMQNTQDHAIIMFAPDGSITDWSLGAEKITGYSAREVIGKSGTLLFTVEDQNNNALAQELEKAAANGCAADIRWHVRKDGSLFWANGSTNALYDTGGRLKGFTKVARDFTDQKRTQEKLQESEERLKRSNQRLQVLADLSSAMLPFLTLPEIAERVYRTISQTLSVDTYACFIYESASESLKLVSSSGFDERPLANDIPCGRMTEENRAVIEHIQASRDPRAAFLRKARLEAYVCHPLITADRLVGTLSFGSRTKQRFEPDELQLLHTVAGLVAIAFDRALTEEGRLRALADFERARTEAEAANKAKTAFLANMSHEIRTPLGAIVGFSELLRAEGFSEDEWADTVDAIIRNGRQLSSLIDDILDISKIEAGHLEIELIDASLPSLVADVVKALKPKAISKCVELMVRFQPGMPMTITTDPTRLRQILFNMIGNAVKFTSYGHIRVEAQLRSEFAGRPAVAFLIKDTGPGIPAEAQEKLFQPFSQGMGSTRRMYGGTGLGLMLARRLAQALGGNVVLTRSVVGEGSAFLVTIDPGPVKDAPIAMPPHDAQAAASVSIRQKSLGGVRVLLADDWPDNQDLVRRILQREGAIVDIVGNGAEALARVSNQNPDVVLMDIQMPVLDGYQTTDKLRQQGFTKPIIALTAHAMQDARDQCLRSGFNDYLTKPLNMTLLLSTVAKFAGRLGLDGGA